MAGLDEAPGILIGGESPDPWARAALARHPRRQRERPASQPPSNPPGIPSGQIGMVGNNVPPVAGGAPAGGSAKFALPPSELGQK